MTPKKKTKRTDTIGPKTNITHYMVAAFDALTKGGGNFALFSCFVNGEPTSAIVATKRVGQYQLELHPIFVAVTPGMVLMDHDGIEPDNERSTASKRWKN